MVIRRRRRHGKIDKCDRKEENRNEMRQEVRMAVNKVQCIVSKTTICTSHQDQLYMFSSRGIYLVLMDLYRLAVMETY